MVDGGACKTASASTAAKVVRVSAAGPRSTRSAPPVAAPGTARTVSSSGFRKRRSLLGVSPVDFLTVGLAGATASSAGDVPNMFIVDADLLDCPNAKFTSIQAAV